MHDQTFYRDHAVSQPAFIRSLDMECLHKRPFPTLPNEHTRTRRRAPLTSATAAAAAFCALSAPPMPMLLVAAMLLPFGAAAAAAAAAAAFPLPPPPKKPNTLFRSAKRDDILRGVTTVYFRIEWNTANDYAGSCVYCCSLRGYAIVRFGTFSRAVRAYAIRECVQNSLYTLHGGWRGVWNECQTVYRIVGAREH